MKSPSVTITKAKRGKGYYLEISDFAYIIAVTEAELRELRRQLKAMPLDLDGGK